MKSRTALNLVTIRGASLLEKLEIAAWAGYAGVGLWANEIDEYVATGGTVEQIADALTSRHLAPVEFCFLGGFIYGTVAERERALSRAEEVFEMSTKVHCPLVLACAPGEAGELREGAEQLGVLGDAAARHGLRIAFEFIGGAEQFHDLATAWEAVRLGDRPNVGLLLDTFHFHKGGSRIEDIRNTPGDKIFLIHINDCPALPRDQLEDSNRVYPGLGAIPLAEMLAALRDVRYSGYFSLETFNRDYWASDPREVAAAGLVQLLTVLR